jgi:ribonuclease-3
MANIAAVNNPYQQLERTLGYSFRNPVLLQQALTHSSYSRQNNERLEFLGDAVLELVITEALYSRFPEATEGQLTRLRTMLVRGQTLSAVARAFYLNDCLRMGAGEIKSGGALRQSSLENALEAVIGALYLDAGLASCRERLLDWFGSYLESLSLAGIQKDPKTRLQEHLQARGAPLPIYEVISVTGKPHKLTFTLACSLSLLEEKTLGCAGSRRAAEQQAAAAALQRLGVDESS